MKKKTLFASIATLALAGFVGFNVIAAEGDETTPDPGTSEEPVEVTPASPISVDPAKNATILSTDNFSRLTLLFSTGDNGMSLGGDNASKNVVITKDGEAYKTYSAATAVKVDASYPSSVYIDFEPITEAGSYTITVPEGVAYTPASYGEDGEVAGAPNAEYVYNFTVKAALPVVCSLPENTTQSLGALATIKLTYPEGTSLQVLVRGEAPEGEELAMPSLVMKVMGQEDQVQTKYNFAVEGNVVTLTAINPEQIAAPSNASYGLDRAGAWLEIPSGLWNAKLDGKDYFGLEQTFGPWLPAAFVKDDFDFSFDMTSEIVLADLHEISVRIPDGVDFIGNTAATGTIVAFYPQPYNVSYALQFRYESLSQDGRVLKLALKDPSSATSLNNNIHFFETGKYEFRILSNNFSSNGNKNGALTWSDLDCKGVDNAVIYTSTPNMGGVTSSKVNGALAFCSLSVSLPFKSRVNPDMLETEVEIMHNGEKVSSFLLGSTTTAAALKETGSKSIAFGGTAAGKFFADAEGNALTAAGAYTAKIPAGAFVQVEGPALSTAATDITVWIPSDLEVNVLPTAAVPGATQDDFQGNVAPESYTHFDIFFPGAKSVAPTAGISGRITNSGFSSTAIANVYKNSGGSGNLDTKKYEVIADENGTPGIRLFTSSPITEAKAPGYVYALNINSGIVDVTYEVEGKEVRYTNNQFRKYYVSPVLAKGSISLGETVTPAELASFQYDAIQSIYSEDAEGAIVLKNAAGETVMTFTKGEVEGNQKAYAITGTVPADLADGEYTIVFEANSIGYGSSSSTSAMRFYNPEEFVFPVKIQNPVEVVLTPASPASFELNQYDLAVYGGALMSLSLNADITLTKNTACTDKIQVYKDDALVMEFGVDTDLFSVIDMSGAGGGGMMPWAEGEGEDLGGTVDTPEVGATMIALDLFYTEDYDALDKLVGAGVYKFVIPEGAMLTADGAPNKAIELTYTVTEIVISGEVGHVFTPAETEVVTDLKKISLTLEAGYVNYVGNGAVTLALPNGTELTAKYPGLSGGFVNGEEVEAAAGDPNCNTLTWEFGDANTVWAEGEYTLTVPADMIAVNIPGFDEWSMEPNYVGCTGKWTVSSTVGVIGIFGDDAEYNIYNTNGAAVILNGTAADVKALNKGVYVINGRTFIIR